MELRVKTLDEASYFARCRVEGHHLPIDNATVRNGFIGDSVNDNKIMPNLEESAGYSIKGYYSEKDGVPACLLSTKTIATRGARLTERQNRMLGAMGKSESKGTWIRQARVITDSIARKLTRKSEEDLEVLL